MSKFWALVKAKIKAAQQWAKEVIASLKGNHKGTTEADSESFDQGDAPS